MKQQTEHEDTCEIDDLPAPPTAQDMSTSASKYGSVPGIPDEELADPEEIERTIYQQEFEPILQLPTRSSNRHIWQHLEHAHDNGAFGTIDFQRLIPEPDPARGKIHALKEKLKDVLITLSIVKEHVPSDAAALALRHLRSGTIGLEHLQGQRMQSLGRLYLQARQLRREIAQADEAGKRRRQAKQEAFLKTLD